MTGTLFILDDEEAASKCTETLRAKDSEFELRMIELTPRLRIISGYRTGDIRCIDAPHIVSFPYFKCCFTHASASGT